MRVKIGNRIKLIKINTKFATKLKAGDLGTVTGLDEIEDTLQIFVNWDNGSKLALLEDDEFEVVKNG